MKYDKYNFTFTSLSLRQHAKMILKNEQTLPGHRQLDFITNTVMPMGPTSPPSGVEVLPMRATVPPSPAAVPQMAATTLRSGTRVLPTRTAPSTILHSNGQSTDAPTGLWPQIRPHTKKYIGLPSTILIFITHKDHFYIILLLIFCFFLPYRF